MILFKYHCLPESVPCCVKKFFLLQELQLSVELIFCACVIKHHLRFPLTLIVLPLPDLLHKRTEGLGQSAHFWWDPHRQSLRGGWWVLPVFRWGWSQGPHPPGQPSEERGPYQTAAQPRGHRQRGRGGGGRRGPATLCASERQPQVHHGVTSTRWGGGGVFRQPIERISLDLEFWISERKCIIISYHENHTYRFSLFSLYFSFLPEGSEQRPVWAPLTENKKCGAYQTLLWEEEEEEERSDPDPLL